MYERFTDRTRKSLQLANSEAQRFNHEYVGTEHLLMGLVKEGGGVAAAVLVNGFGVDLLKIRLEVEKLVQSGPEIITIGKLPHTPRAKNAIEYAMDESRNLGHNYVGTEHLLLGLLREKEGVAGQVLTNLGVTIEETREVLGAMMQSWKSKQEEDVIELTPRSDYEKMVEELRPLLLQQANIMEKILKIVTENNNV